MDTQSGFVHTHLHDEFSTLDGINRTKSFPKVCKEMGMTHVAQTNHGNCAGHLEFYKSCKAAGIHPILGMEAYTALGSRHIKERDELNKFYYHMILLAQNNTGLHNLHKLSSFAYTEGFYRAPRIDDELLSQHNEGVLATTACLGSKSSQLILRGEYKAAEQIIDHHASIFKDRFFIELQAHRGDEQKKVNEVLIQIANKKNLPLILTADAHYTHQEDKHHHEVALKMATNSGEDGFSFGDIECFICTHDEMWARASASGIPYEAISNTVALANTIDDASYFSDVKNRWPRFKSLPEGITSFQYLESLAHSGLVNRIGYPFPDEYAARLKYELSLFKYMDMSDYLLIVAEYTQAARDLECAAGPGRGSVAGSLVAWAIGITEIDPVKYGLIVQRFTNEGRASTPLIF